MRDTDGTGTPTGKSVKQVWALVGKHLHLANANDGSCDSESTRSDVNSGPPGVSGVAGIDAAVGVPVSDSAIFFSFFENSQI